MDLAPTVLSLLNIEPPPHYDGKAFAGPFEDQPRKYAFGTADRFDESTDMQRSVLDGRFVYIKNFMPELPLIYRNKYRERIPMNSKLIQMDSQGELDGDASYIFMKTKEVEELYDLQEDPYEVKNVATNPEYADKLVELRNALSAWQIEIDDKGFLPENEIVKSFWPDMKQPVTEDVVFSLNSDGLLSLTTVTPGASIGYQLDENIGSDSWKFYHKPLRINEDQQIAARAIRIGFKASNITLNQN